MLLRMTPQPFSGTGERRYLLTRHAQEKMRQYRLSESRVRRVIRHPERIEEGIAPNTVAAMQPAATRRKQEIWAMYRLVPRRKLIKIITAWRYPGESPKRNPVPENILREVRALP
ncbi:DUF4258 domain-containing protein [Candidatus Parcubacteria bacterium]|nr:DUF4258 domain-containing protein [Candidatus Parcubacteria bacterium]